MFSWPSTICYSIPTLSWVWKKLWARIPRLWSLHTIMTVFSSLFCHLAASLSSSTTITSLGTLWLGVCFTELLYLSLQTSSDINRELVGVERFATTISRASSRGAPMSFRRRQSRRHACCLVTSSAIAWTLILIVNGKGRHVFFAR